MSQIRRNLYRRKLKNHLGYADDNDFFLMVWAAFALQNGREQRAREFIQYPPDAATQDFSSPYAAHPWKLETLLNELLTIEKVSFRPNSRNRQLDCRKFITLASVLNCLGGLENAEDGLTLQRINVMREMHRLTQRQFEWQRGFVTHQQLYRSGYIYGGDLTKAHFEQQYDFSMDDFSLSCFALKAIYNEQPIIRANGGLSAVGISRETLEKIFRVISLPHDQARRMASDLRAGAGHVAYKRSVFRQYPCIAFGVRNEMIHSPLPDLIVLRGTAGLFYDVMRADGSVRNEISDKFECYCRDLLANYVGFSEVKRSFSYRFRGNSIDSPDIIFSKDDSIRVVFECKARRMSYEAIYSENPVVEAQNAYLEIAKGVFQIWRFISHHRRGFLRAERVSPLVKGVVLTLDTWLTMAEPMQREVLALAEQMATERDPEILPEDKIPVVFCPISDLEITLSASDEASFLAAIDAASADEHFGWQLSAVHRQMFPDTSHGHPYPFTSRIGEVLPWWQRLVGVLHE